MSSAPDIGTFAGEALGRANLPHPPTPELSGHHLRGEVGAKVSTRGKGHTAPSRGMVIRMGEPLQTVMHSKRGKKTVRANWKVRLSLRVYLHQPLLGRGGEAGCGDKE